MNDRQYNGSGSMTIPSQSTTPSRDFEMLSGRNMHKDTLTRLGDLYYTRCKELEAEKQKKDPDTQKISRLETRIIPDLKKYAQYASIEAKQKLR